LLLRRTSSIVAFWRAVFPGIFLSLYGAILSGGGPTGGPPKGPASTNPRVTSAGGLLESIETTALTCMAELLRATLAPVHEREERRRSDASKVGRDHILSQLASLAKKEHRNPSKQQQGTAPPLDGSSSLPDVGTDGEEQPPTEGDFMDKVRSGVVAPLSNILKQSATSRWSHPTREAVISLCRVLLVDTRCCWSAAAPPSGTASSFSRKDGPGGNRLETLPFEICMMLERDRQGTCSA
jgi:hypothetical protein